MMTSSMPPPGWYPSPSGEPGQRYWDGRNWTIVNVPAMPPPGWYPNPSGEPGQRYWDGRQSTSVDSPPENPAREEDSSIDSDSPAEVPLRLVTIDIDLPGNQGVLRRTVIERGAEAPPPGDHLGDDGPAPADSSKRSFLERHRTAIVVGAVLLLGGLCAAAVATLDNKQSPPDTARSSSSHTDGDTGGEVRRRHERRVRRGNESGQGSDF